MLLPDVFQILQNSRQAAQLTSNNTEMAVSSDKVEQVHHLTQGFHVGPT